MKMDTHLNGRIPSVPADAKFNVGDHYEEYRRTGAGACFVWFKFLVTFYFCVFSNCLFVKLSEEFLGELKGSNVVKYEVNDVPKQVSIDDTITYKVMVMPTVRWDL